RVPVPDAMTATVPVGLHTRLPVVKKVLAAVRTLDRFGISDRAGAAILSAAPQDVVIVSESNVLNVVVTYSTVSNKW
ncbi:hypothetical protein AVEN_44675-1, partial [Araneus ventricosus]